MKKIKWNQDNERNLSKEQQEVKKEDQKKFKSELKKQFANSQKEYSYRRQIKHCKSKSPKIKKNGGPFNGLFTRDCRSSCIRFMFPMSKSQKHPGIKRRTNRRMKREGEKQQRHAREWDVRPKDEGQEAVGPCDNVVLRRPNENGTEGLSSSNGMHYARQNRRRRARWPFRALPLSIGSISLSSCQLFLCAR